MIDLSVIIPAHDERDNIAPLLAELDTALETMAVRSEIIVVDDGSTDGTDAALRGQCERFPRLRALRFRTRSGQTAAIRAGIAESRGRVIATMDADLQNDPADLAALLRVLDERNADLVQGDRTGRRRDGLVKRCSSNVARVCRRTVLADAVRDTGCTLRVMRRSVATTLPLSYCGMHRFIPVLARDLGFLVVEHPVSHRRRFAGRSHYGLANRAARGLVDLLAVRWMQRRRTPEPTITRISEPAAPGRLTGSLSA